MISDSENATSEKCMFTRERPVVEGGEERRPGREGARLRQLHVVEEPVGREVQERQRLRRCSRCCSIEEVC